MTSVVVLVARLLLSAVFLVSGTRKLMAFAAVSGMMTKIGFPAADVMLAGAIAIDLVAGVLLVVGWQPRLIGSVLAAYALVLAVVFHAFWAAPNPAAFSNELNHFLKNLGLAGGLLLVAMWPKERRSLE